VIVPVLLRGGERLFDNLDGGPDSYEYAEIIASSVVHARLTRTGAGS